ncbi:MAG: DNA-binding NarL/FixJ family response regulator [Pirellulaceae bacterium]|jgi:DNA-binding NarL/FixJ family response regulator
MAIRILIADDHEVVRRGLAVLLENTDIEIVAEASSGDEVVERVRTHQPDVTLLDVRMPEADGLSALESIRKECPAARVVMLSTYDNPTYVARCVALGAVDYLLKGSQRQTLVDAIRSAAAGNSPRADSILYRVKQVMSKRDETIEGLPLTRRELQVLRHVALGLSNREIGRSLGISVETVKEHVQNILRKIQATDRTQAAVFAVKRGLA